MANLNKFLGTTWKAKSWQRRAAILASVVISGVVVGVLSSRAVLSAVAGHTTTYCVFSYKNGGNPPPACTVMKTVDYFGIFLYYVCVPCPPDSGGSSLSEGDAAKYANNNGGDGNFSASDFFLVTPCGKCAPPPYTAS
jgi:hypothetical protein